jgi:hypothetical protein
MLAACVSPAKEDVLDETPLPVPTEAGKADASANVVAVNIQSPHPYANNLNRVFAVPMTSLPQCTTSARIHFRVLRTEADYDYVTIEPVGQPKQEFTGRHDDTWSEWFALAATYANVRLESDSSIRRHGFEIDQIEWNDEPNSCPQVGTCGAGMVDCARAPAACECRPQPVCAPIANALVEHHLAWGFDNTTKHAYGPVAKFTHPGPADAPMTETIGSIDTVRLAALVREAAAQGLLQGAGYTQSVPAGQYRDRFRIRAGSYDVTFIAAKGAHSAAVQQLIAEFETLFTCSGGGGLTCGTSYSCQQNQCIKL